MESKKFDKEAYKARMISEQDAPRLSKIGETDIIAIEEEGYFIDLKIGVGYDFKINDHRKPKGTLCTPWIHLDKLDKIYSSPKAKPIRDALKEVYGDKKYSDYTNRLLVLIENNSHYFEIPQEEIAEQEKDEENPGAILVRLARANAEGFFHDQLDDAYITFIEKLDAKDTLGTKGTKILTNPFPLDIHLDNNAIDIVLTTQSNVGIPSVHSVQSDHILRTIRVKSRECKQWMAKIYYRDQGKTAGGDAISSAILVIESYAMMEEKRTMYNRVAPDGEGGIWWDMSNELGQAIHINKEGWKIENHPPQIFRHYNHQEPLAYPAESGAILPLLDYILLNEPGQSLLSICTPISYLIPEVPHVIEFVGGSKGSIKSSRHRFNKKIIDPSSIPLLTMPKDVDQMVQHADHHYLLCYDNVTKIEEDQSDLMCRIVTGLGFSKRMLYTDDDTVIRQLMRCININGINLPADKPDLLDRSVIQTTEMIKDSKRKTEAQMKIKMATDAPKVIRAMLDVLVSALNLYDTIKPIRNNRMADFTHWGCSITQAMGIEKAYFENAYYDNINTQNEEAVKSNPVAEWLISFMEYNNYKKYTASSSELLQSIIDFAKDVYNRDLNWVDGWPKGATPFGRKLKEVIPSLKAIGYHITYVKSGSRKYNITKLVDPDADKGEKGQRTLVKVPTLTLEKLRASLLEFENRYLILSDSNEISVVKTLDVPKSIKDQMAYIFKIMVDHDGPIKETAICDKTRHSVPELRKLLHVMDNDGLVKQIKPETWVFVEME